MQPYYQHTQGSTTSEDIEYWSLIDRCILPNEYSSDETGIPESSKTTEAQQESLLSLDQEQAKQNELSAYGEENKNLQSSPLKVYTRRKSVQLQGNSPIQVTPINVSPTPAKETMTNNKDDLPIALRKGTRLCTKFPKSFHNLC